MVRIKSKKDIGVKMMIGSIYMYKVTEKALSKQCKKQPCRDALPAKNSSPKTNETSDNAHRKACTDYPHITVRCIYRVATIPTFLHDLECYGVLMLL